VGQWAGEQPNKELDRTARLPDAQEGGQYSAQADSSPALHSRHALSCHTLSGHRRSHLRRIRLRLSRHRLSRPECKPLQVQQPNRPSAIHAPQQHSQNAPRSLLRPSAILG